MNNVVSTSKDAREHHENTKLISLAVNCRRILTGGS